MPAISLPLTIAGPIVPIQVHLSIPQLKVRQSTGIPIPAPYSGRGLIDTGADSTLIDSKIAVVLALQSLGTALIFTPSRGKIPFACNSFDVSLWLGQSPVSGTVLQYDPINLAFEVYEADLSPQQIDVLIGRDVLDQCHFTYDGKQKRFSIVFGP